MMAAAGSSLFTAARPPSAEGVTSGAREIYALHGLRIRSAVPLAGVPVPDGPHDLDVLWDVGPAVPAGPPPGRVVVARADAHGQLYVGARHAPRFTLRVPTIGDFVVDEGRRTITCRLDPRTDRQFAAVLVAGLVVASLLILEGRCVLHASAVELGGRAIAFAGGSRAGKSTLAALLCAGGARLVSDDTLRVDVEPEPLCIRGGTQLRLRSGGTWALDQFKAPPASTPTVDDRLGLAPFLAGPATALTAVVLPRLSRTAGATEVRPVAGVEATLRLAGSVRVPGWSDPDVVRHQFHMIGALADRVPVFEAVIPWGPPFRSPIVPALLELVGECA